MPRGVYKRKGKVATASEFTVSGPPPLIDIAPARACSRCLAFDPTGEGETNGLCRMFPKAEWVRVDGWCMQFRGKEGA